MAAAREGAPLGLAIGAAGLGFAAGLVLRKRWAPIALATLTAVVVHPDGPAAGVGVGLATGVLLQLAVHLLRPGQPTQ